MKVFDSNELKMTLQQLGIQASDTLLIHSSLFHLGSLKGVSFSNIPVEIVNHILNLLGPSGTIVVPTFNFDFCKGIPFDLKHSPSQGMGVFSETVRTWKGAKRSKHPMQSVAAIGKLASWISEPDTASSFGDGGPFERMFDLDTKLLLLGASMQYASLIHYSEEKQSVPYRYWKTFQGSCTNAGDSEEREYPMFVRDLSLDPRLQLSILEDEMDRNGQIKKKKLGSGQVVLCTFKDFFATSSEMLKKDPFCLLDNRKEVISKLKEGNEINVS